MADQKVDIESYAGYKGEESPRVFFVRGEKTVVLNILRMWIEEGEQDRKRRQFFSVEGGDGFVHTLYRDSETDAWFYRGVVRAGSRLRQHGTRPVSSPCTCSLLKSVRKRDFCP